jgi:CPA2 family monovalent cation:H+ antiporter-2
VIHLPILINDLALVLGIAGAVGLLCRLLNQPMVLGYLLAGILVGPYVPGFPTVVDIENIKVWANLGIIFLLFVLGLEFSFRKLFEVGKSALIVAVFEVTGMMAAGYALGIILGWDHIEALFVGGILAISSTTIIVKAFDEQHLTSQPLANFVFGILIIEDLCAIIILAILSTVGATRSLHEVSLLEQMGSLAALLIVGIPIGLWITPRFLKFIRPQTNDETRVIVSLALCLGLVILSTYAGFSPALGAFLMGAFMGETAEGEKIERLLKPVRDLFGAIFFTSIGMLANLETIFSNFFLVVLMTLITIGGKILFTTGGALVAKQNSKKAFQAGLCLAQIGEFSFIIATLGLTLNVIRPELYPIVVSVSLLTTFATPYLIRLAINHRSSGTPSPR